MSQIATAGSWKRSRSVAGRMRVSGCDGARRNADPSLWGRQRAAETPLINGRCPMTSREAATGIGRETPPYRNASLADIRPSGRQSADRQAPHASLTAPMNKTPMEEKASVLSGSFRPSGLQVTQCNQQHALHAALTPESGRTSRQPDVNDTVHFGR